MSNKPYYNQESLLINERTLNFKQIMKLKPVQRDGYYLGLTEEQVEGLIEEIQEGLKNGTISEREVINFRRLGNSNKKRQLAKAKAAETEVLRKKYKELVGKDPGKIPTKYYGIDCGKFDIVQVYDVTEIGEMIVNSTKVKFDLNNKPNIEYLKTMIIEKYSELYDTLVYKAEELGSSTEDANRAKTPISKYINAFKEYIDRINYLMKFKDIDERFEKLGIDEFVCNLYRKDTFSRKSNYEILTEKEFLSEKSLREKIFGKKKEYNTKGFDCGDISDYEDVLEEFRNKH